MALSPQPPYSPTNLTTPPTLVPLGDHTAVVVADDAGDGYILADIAGGPSSTAAGRPALPEAKIFAWPLNNKDGEWVPSSILQLPLPAHLCGPSYFFEIDMAFSLDGGRICWVDLLQGILLCDHLMAPQGPSLSFIPLPPGCCRDVHHKRRHVVMPIAHRSIACVSGVIKFVALDVGWGPNAPPPKEVMLTTWALSPDFKDWKEDSKPLSVGDIWESDSYKQMGLPPDLYAVFTSPQPDRRWRHEIPEQVDEFGFLADDNQQLLVHRGSYMIRFDIVQNKVLSSTRVAESRDWRWTMPNIIAVDFSAYLQDHKRAEEASASTKGKKRKQME
uniref:DUF1618 domain-containing protein n=1 Tax=Oryza brachyantha TaxID=4533 RepID=J3KVX5_ORYBR